MKTKKHVKAIKAAKQLIEYCAECKEDCTDCIFYTNHGCAICGSPFEYEIIFGRKQGAKE